MPRITCKTPSNGRPLNLTAVNVGTSYQTLAEAPDFSVPDTAGTYPVRDPADGSRAIRPGEVSFITPLLARNKTETTRWIEVQLVLEGGTVIACPGRVAVPAGDTVAIPVQGRALVKRTATGSTGDRLQVRAEATATFDIWAGALERPSAEHVGVA